MDVNIALLAGDGIGPEIIAEATKVLDRVAAKFGHRFDYREALVGACAIDATGDPYPDETHAICQAADAVLFGAIGAPKYDNDPKAPVRPEQGLLRMRKSLGLFANLRPHRIVRHAGQPLAAQGRGGARHRFHLRARTDERHLFRPTAGAQRSRDGRLSTPAPTRARRSNVCWTSHSGSP